MWTMAQNVSKGTMSGIKKRYQISFRRWIINGSGGGTIKPYVGASPYDVRKWLESMFVENMNWTNYGQYWVIDHVVPVRLFDLTIEDELKVVWNYKNTMPLLKEDNLLKEGALDFSMRMLDRLPPCEIVLKLKEKLRPEIERMEKYIKKENGIP